MGSATLNLTVVQKRMMTETEAASYSGLPRKHFLASCPVRPVELHPGAIRYDRNDLDHWIDMLKNGDGDRSRDDILSRLG